MAKKTVQSNRNHLRAFTHAALRNTTIFKQSDMQTESRLPT